VAAITCVDCGKQRDPFRPIVKLMSGRVLFACKKCWVTSDYREFMYPALTLDDQQSLARANRST
jgi:hypothetical protein